QRRMPDEFASMKYSLNGHRHGHQKTAKPKGSGSGLATRYWPRNNTQTKAVRHNRWMRCYASLPRTINRIGLEIEIGKRLPGAVDHDKTGFQFVNGPRRGKAAFGHPSKT